MSIKTVILSLTCCVALGACSNNGLFGSTAADEAAAAAEAAGAGANAGGITTAAIDQTSLEFFSNEVGDRVLFAVDQSTLTPSAIATLDAQASWLSANPAATAQIEGHADEVGTRDYNIALGQRRAEAVRNYLISRGVAPARITTVSFGKERPLAVCSEESCWSQNRRAVTAIAGGVMG